MYRKKLEKFTPADRVRDRVVTLLLIISFFLFIGSISQTSKKIRLVDKEVFDREKELQELQDEEASLKAKLEEVTSEEYMEKQLRNQLNMSRDNEIILVLPEDDILRKLVPPDEVEEDFDTKPNWRKWATLFGLI